MVTSLHDHPAQAELFVRNQERAHWHDQALWFVRAKRDRAAASLPEWELLRNKGAAIKRHTLSHLADYLEQFAQQAEQRGAVVHWARDAKEHNEIVLQILQQHGVHRVAKSKSMLTEECHLNPFLEQHGIEVVDTDLGERIVQLRQEPPSHIVLPAIHIKKEEVGEVFHEHLGTAAGASDPNYLTEAAREHLRQKFIAAEAGLTGVNFAVAESGGLVICTYEGNADLGVALPNLHIASMGIEKLVPGPSELAVFIRLLARSHFRAGENWAAVHHQRRAIQTAPPFVKPFLYERLGAMYAQLGKTKHACQALRQALKDRPRLAAARRRSKELCGR